MTNQMSQSAFLAQLAKAQAVPVGTSKKNTKPFASVPVQTISLDDIIGAAKTPAGMQGNMPATKQKDARTAASKEKKANGSRNVDMPKAKTASTAQSQIPTVPAQKHVPDDVENLSSMVAALISSAKAQAKTTSVTVTETTASAAVMQRNVGQSFAEVFQPALREQEGFLGADEQYISIDRLAQNRKAKCGKLKVAAYIRVSTEALEQEDSYETQERYFSKLLAENTDWISAGVYSDYGISATSDRNRIGFQRLLRHCREGKVDRIVCKSISRFARNTSDFMTALKVLREHAVTIFFEKENLDTADPTSDFIMTTLGAIAQEESRSISENIRWGFNKRYPKGEAKNYVIYGYRYAEGMDAYEVTESGYRRRRIEIVEEEAAVVRRVFQMVAEGEQYKAIARTLNNEGIPAPVTNWTRNSKRAKEGTPYAKGILKDGIEQGWTASRISSMVRMERYAGDVILQKVFTPDFLSHKTQKNNGERPQYYVADNHPAIVSRELFQTVQKIVEGNAIQNRNRGERHLYPFSQRIICGHCGRFFHTRNRGNYPIWQCPSTMLANGKHVCSMEKVYEEQIIRVMRRAIIERFGLIKTTLYDDVKLADIFSGCYQINADESVPEGYAFAECFDSFVGQMRARLEHVQRMDYTERDRAFIKRQILAVQTEKDAILRKKRLAQSQIDAMLVRREVLGDTGVDEDELSRLKLDMETGDARLVLLESEEKSLLDKLSALEEYWRELEQDFEWRDQAIEWMKGLPEGQQGTLQFLNGLTDVYVKAFALSITVFSLYKYSIHWFDDTRTEVTMTSNIEDYRFTAMYWDGSKMCMNPRYKPRRK